MGSYLGVGVDGLISGIISLLANRWASIRGEASTLDFTESILHIVKKLDTSEKRFYMYEQILTLQFT